MSPVVVLRHRSLNHCSCSRLPSGMSRREDLAERRVVLPPGHAHEIDHGPVLLPHRRRAAQLPSPCETSIQNHPADALGMTEGVADARGPTLRDPEQRHRFLGSSGIDDRSEICEPLIERQGTALPVAHAAAALVVPNEPEVRGEELNPVSPDRTLPLVLEVREPVGCLDDERTGAGLGPCEARPVPRVDVAHVLTELRRSAHVSDRDICLTSGSAILVEPGQSADGLRVSPAAFSWWSQEGMPCSNACCSSRMAPGVT